MNRQKQIGRLAVGDGRARLERHILIIAPREHDFESLALLQDLFEPERDVEHESGFGDAERYRAGIVSAVAWIDHDPRNAEPELAGHGECAAAVHRRGDRRRPAC